MKSCLLLAALLLTTGWLFAKTDVLFSSQGGIQRRLVSSIDHAARTLDIALFDLTAESILQALKRAGLRGVTIRMVLDATTRKEHGHDGELKGTPNLEIRALGGRSRSRGLMHHKFAIIDGDKMETGSYNWTKNAEYSNYENAHFIDDPEIISAYQTEFTRLWNDAARGPARTVHFRYPKRSSRRARVPVLVN